MSRFTVFGGMVLLLTFTQVSMAQQTTAVGTPGDAEPLYPYDSQEPWMHGYWQEMPYYGGFRAFRPYNYKHVLSQSQTAAGWGMAPNMPYSQQFWPRYQEKASMSPFEVYSPGAIPRSQPQPLPMAPGGMGPSTVPMAPMIQQEGLVPNTAVPNSPMPNYRGQTIQPQSYQVPGYQPQMLQPQVYQPQTYLSQPQAYPMSGPALNGPLR